MELTQDQIIAIALVVSLMLIAVGLSARSLDLARHLDGLPDDRFHRHKLEVRGEEGIASGRG